MFGLLMAVAGYREDTGPMQLCCQHRIPTVWAPNPAMCSRIRGKRVGIRVGRGAPPKSLLQTRDEIQDGPNFRVQMLLCAPALAGVRQAGLGDLVRFVNMGSCGRFIALGRT